MTHIKFEAGAIKLLKHECEHVGISRPLIVTDQGVKAAGMDAIAHYMNTRLSLPTGLAALGV